MYVERARVHRATKGENNQVCAPDRCDVWFHTTHALHIPHR
jgi:hypothetical protein